MWEAMKVEARRKVRVQVLRETLTAMAGDSERARYRQLAEANLQRWRAGAQRRAQRAAEVAGLRVEVLAGDWGEVAGRVTRQSGQCYAVLNMANAHVPGGGYLHGTAAQEENMFRRTDCHYSLQAGQLSADGQRYSDAMTRLISGWDGRVMLDLACPRVCIRGAEVLARDDLGYPWLADDAVFAFYEMRAAAQNCSRGQRFDVAEARRRIDAQLDTLVAGGIRHAVLGAFGCGAFANPAQVVAALYRDSITERWAHFSHIVFAVYDAGYGPDNFTPFAEAFADSPWSA